MSLVTVGIVYVTIELIFYVYVQWIVHRENRRSPENTQPVFENSIELTRDIYRLVSRLFQEKIYSIEKLISGFCLMSDIKNIYSYNFKSLLTWCCYVKTLAQCTPEETRSIDGLYEEFIQELQKEDLDMGPGYCSAINHIKPNLEKIVHIHRPLLLYAIFYLLEQYFEIFFLRRRGFKKYGLIRGSFWICERPNRPCVFILHGICRGWSYYRELIDATYKNNTVVLLDYDCIKINSFEFHVPQPEEYSNNFAHIVQTFQLRDITLIGHSYGTFLSGWLLRKQPQHIRRVLFVDAVCFTVGLYEIAYYIFYKRPVTFSDYMFRMFVTYNIHIASLLQRKFAWYNHVIKFDEIPPHIEYTVFISEKDEMYNVGALCEELNHHKGNKVIWKGVCHGEYNSNRACIHDIAQFCSNGFAVSEK
jgi:pimeloyl-ACP methyl ester carboxylesterase